MTALSPPVTVLSDFDSIYFGSYGLTPHVPAGDARILANSFFRLPEDKPNSNSSVDVDAYALSYPAGAYVRTSVAALNQYLFTLPVAKGFRYKVWVTPYVGIPDSKSTDVVRGQSSAPYTVDGDIMACYARLGTSADYEDKRIPELYECDDVRPYAHLYQAPPDVLAEAFSGVTLLNLTGTTICH